MARTKEENLGPMKLIFNYNNVFYSFFYDDLSGCVHRSREKEFGIAPTAVMG